MKNTLRITFYYCLALLLFAAEVPVSAQDYYMNYSARRKKSCCEFPAGVKFFYGYGITKYDPVGWNGYIDVYNQRRPTLDQKMDHFGSAAGLYWGFTFVMDLNFMRSQFSDMDFTFIKANGTEKHQAKLGTATREYVVDLKQYAFAWGITMPVGRNLEWRVLSLDVSMNYATLTNNYTDPATTTTQKLESDMGVGFSGATQFTLYLMPWLSVSVQAGYGMTSISYMKFSNGYTKLSKTEVSTEEMDDFISGWGPYYRAQVGIEFP